MAIIVIIYKLFILFSMNLSSATKFIYSVITFDRTVGTHHGASKYYKIYRQQI